MSLAAIILVLISSITHTTWNSISKNFKVSCKSIAIAMTISIIVFFPLFYIVRESFHIIKIFLLPGLLSGFTNALAFWALLAAYRKGDLSFVYPLKNALPILMSTIFAIIIGKGLEITPLAYFGFAIIIIGCILLPIYNSKIIKLDTFFNRAILFTVIAAFGSTVYSNIDSSIISNIKALTPGISNFHIGVLYVPYMALVTSIFLIPFMLIDGKFYKIDYKEEKINYLLCFLTGVFINVGYLLVFIAYGLAENVNYVVAFRQSGMVLTMLVGFIFFKEKAYPCKIIGCFLILSGLVLTALF